MQSAASASRLIWVKSSYSGVNNNCLEAAVLPTGGHALRDSKNPHGPVLLLGPGQWSAFVSGVTAGDFG
ncbi:DUF397 domain-containing protein [Streptomyces sp. NPDC059568]|uniref:DUF397 domain-containing protein n=1 Tax=Streptomyces sp. NPDC059568 TaxID=3346868 RepID=UPI003689B21B